MMSLLRPGLLTHLRRSHYFQRHSEAHISESEGQKTPEFSIFFDEKAIFYEKVFPDGSAFVTLLKYKDVDDVIAKWNTIYGRIHSKKIETLGASRLLAWI